MANNMLIEILLLLCVVPSTLGAKEQTSRSKYSILLETTGDTILAVFVDANYGPYCNVTSSKGLQQISTALYVARTLNKYDYVPGVTLALRILDTCHDGTTVFRRSLRAAVEQDDKIGVLMPSRYGPAASCLRDYGGLPVLMYDEQNLTESTIAVLAHYLSTSREIVDQVLAEADSVFDRFLEITRDFGVCVKGGGRNINDDDDDDDREANVTETVIVAIGGEDDIRGWLRQDAEELKKISLRRTWLLLALDNSNIDDVIPSGSYIIKPETSDLTLGGVSSVDEFPENSKDSAHRSPYLLGIGKAIIGLAEVLQDVRKRNYSINEDSERLCIASHAECAGEIHDSDVYEVLRMQPRSHVVRYVVAQKKGSRHDLVDIARYAIEVSRSRVLPEEPTSGLPGLCLGSHVGNCENCTNFQERIPGTRILTEADIVGKSVLKDDGYILGFLMAIVCGTLVCCIIMALIVRRVSIEGMDGNATLMIVLTLADMFTLLAALPFCMADDYLGAETFNSRKILLISLAFTFAFSIVLSRALFLALSTGDVLVFHVNGYLQSVMVFFMSAVQIAMSLMYLDLNATRSSVTVRSLVALLGYDIFLLIALFVACCYVIRIRRNYNEGKCLFGTAVGLSTLWMVWLSGFVVIRPENRDMVVAFGTIGTAYSIIFGILVPRICHMVTCQPRRRKLGRKLRCVDLTTDSIDDTNIGQPARENQDLQVSPVYSNRYGDPSRSLKYRDRCRSPNYREMLGYSNYAFKAEMKEINAARITSQTCAEPSPRNLKVATSNDVVYTQPRIYRSESVVLTGKRSTAITRNRDNPLSAGRLRDKMYPIKYSRSPANVSREQRIEKKDEEQEAESEFEQVDEENEDVSRF